MSSSDVINLISAAVSTVLAVLAIWLSIVFYRMSTSEAERSQRSAEEISRSVQRLEAVFNAMYSDTFSMMRDTVTDMRAHVWRASSTESEADVQTTISIDEEATKAAQEELMSHFTDVWERLGYAEGKIDELRDSVAPALAASVQPVAHSTPMGIILENRLTYVVKKFSNITTAQLASHRLVGQTGAKFEEVAAILHSLRQQGLVTWDGDPDTIASDTVIVSTDQLRQSDVHVM